MKIRNKISAYMLVILYVFLLGGGVAFSDDTFIDINATSFPDIAFRAYVKKNFDTDSDGKLSTAEISAVTTISVSHYQAPGEITDDHIFHDIGVNGLRGVEFFTELTFLDCSKNELRSLDISKNTKLTTLYCSGAWLSELDVTKHTALIDLQCAGNYFSSFDVSKNTALVSLDCGIEELTGLDVTKNTNLKSLRLEVSKLTQLDLSKNTALTFLLCNRSSLTALDLSKNTALTTLECCQNPNMTRLTLPETTSLTKITCYENKLSGLDVSKNTALTQLTVSNNEITTIDITKNTALTGFSVSMNKLTELDVSKNTALTDLGCAGNKITKLDVCNNTALTGLSVGDNELTTLDISKNTALIGLGLYQNHFTTFDLSKHTALTRLTIWGQTATVTPTATNNKEYPCSLPFSALGMDASMFNERVLPLSNNTASNDNDVAVKSKVDVKDKNGKSLLTSTDNEAIYFSGLPATMTYQYDYKANIELSQVSTMDVTVTFTPIELPNIPDNNNSDVVPDNTTPSTPDKTPIDTNTKSDDKTIPVTSTDITKSNDVIVPVSPDNTSGNGGSNTTTNGSTVTLETPQSPTSLLTLLNDTLKQALESGQTTTLSIPANVTDLKGLANITLIVRLDLSKASSLTNISSEDVATVQEITLSGNTSIKQVNLSGNSSVKIIVLTGSGVESFSANGSNLETIEIAGSPIKELELQDTALTSLDLTGCTSLDKFDCSASGEGRIRAIDLTDCPNIREFNCSGNALPFLDVDYATHPRLENFNCVGQRVSVSQFNNNAISSDIIDFERMFANFPPFNFSRIGANVICQTSDGQQHIIPFIGNRIINLPGNTVSISYGYDTGAMASSVSNPSSFDRFFRNSSVIKASDENTAYMDVTFSYSTDNEQTDPGNSGGGCSSMGNNFVVVVIALGFVLFKINRA
ncbi:MAG: hypothetical protein IJP69_02530 [Synergistaceae bacterium]|nr:hypothetical protein [Synergistaceae bacterium]